VFAVLTRLLLCVALPRYPAKQETNRGGDRDADKRAPTDAAGESLGMSPSLPGGACGTLERILQGRRYGITHQRFDFASQTPDLSRRVVSGP
jgi:hypothetical protein